MLDVCTLFYTIRDMLASGHQSLSFTSKKNINQFFMNVQFSSACPNLQQPD